MKYIIVCLLLWLSATTVSAQSKADLKTIENLCGCFEVQFQYAETLAPDEEYEYRNRERISKVTELVLPIEKTNKKFMLQHLLIINDSIIVKHWREDWVYESPVLFNYLGDKVWEKQQLSRDKVKNRWTQTVWEVSDAPRYQGVSEWVNTDNKTFWMNTTFAPLPRREYSKRKDYNIMNRRNMIVVDASGWIHEQDNQKIIREGGKDSLLTEEKGINSYKRLPDSQCAAGLKYWEKNQAYWARVRDAWDSFLNDHASVHVAPSVDGKPMFVYLNDIEEAVATKKISLQDADARIQSVFGKFVSEKAKDLQAGGPR